MEPPSPMPNPTNYPFAAIPHISRSNGKTLSSICLLYTLKGNSIEKDWLETKMPNHAKNTY
jgi:hypothetical protein